MLHQSGTAQMSRPFLIRPFLISLAATVTALAIGACLLPPDPEETVEAEPLIAGAWKPADRVVRQATGANGADSLGPLDEGRWAAKVEPHTPEAMPDVAVTLSGVVTPGASIGSVSYAFERFSCAYELIVHAAAGRTLELRQRRAVGPCSGAGRILLSWDEAGSLIGDWRRPDGTRWFRVRLAKAADLPLEPDDPGNGGGEEGEIVGAAPPTPPVPDSTRDQG